MPEIRRDFPSPQSTGRGPGWSCARPAGQYLVDARPTSSRSIKRRWQSAPQSSGFATPCGKSLPLASCEKSNLRLTDRLTPASGEPVKSLVRPIGRGRFGICIVSQPHAERYFWGACHRTEWLFMGLHALWVGVLMAVRIRS